MPLWYDRVWFTCLGVHRHPEHHLLFCILEGSSLPVANLQSSCNPHKYERSCIDVRTIHLPRPRLQPCLNAMSTAVVKNLTSKDGTTIYSDAIGDPSKPHIVFVHGLSLSGAVFNDVFADARYNSEFYMVRPAFPSPSLIKQLTMISGSI